MKEAPAECADCRYFKELYSRKDEGNCLRNAPVSSPYLQQKILRLLADIHFKIYDGQPTSFFGEDASFESLELNWADWPIVQSEDWCGEWKADENPVRKESEQGFTGNHKIFWSIDELVVSVRLYRCLKLAGFQYIGDVVVNNEAAICRIPNLGRRSRTELIEVLAAEGLHLGMQLQGWPYPPDEMENYVKMFRKNHS